MLILHNGRYTGTEYPVFTDEIAVFHENQGEIYIDLNKENKQCH
jgi:hypothetical protein